MMYKGYTAHVEQDPEDGVLHGWVDNIEDVVTFEADNPEDLERAPPQVAAHQRTPLVNGTSWMW